MSVEAAAQDRVKCLLTIKRNKRSPSSETAAHHHRNAHVLWRRGQAGGRPLGSAARFDSIIAAGKSASLPA
jgi:hypothetical protein